MPVLSEGDLALIHALQLRPRASWTELGRTLGVDAVTAARRFRQLTERGEAWVGVSPGPTLLHRLCVAFAEIDCAAGAADAVAGALRGHPHAVTIERTADTHRLLATVVTADIAAMARYTLDVLSAVPGIAAVRTRIVTHMFAEGGQWQIDALDREQRSLLRTPPGGGETGRGTGSEEITSRDRTLLSLLHYDGRASFQTLAEALGTTAFTVRRRLDRLTRLGLVRFRCDFARPLGGWPVAVTFWATAPVRELPAVGHALVRLPEVRNCAAVTGEHNLVVQATLHSVSDVPRLEIRLCDVHPGLVVTDRTMTLRHDKLLGRVLDPRGRSLGVVPPDVWCEPGTSAPAP
ncbi:Lrp/AsnC family transcriptional regulator [Streptomyces griseoruber]|uniref:Lrp/AsnC family transcriptional regulator n=1 Tax=Streptomyces griseoruber TaxID=1943 RepID=UPI001FD2BFAD|nr:Lrp/AsnC family transcriptional regulator [Streptomyces griseoruber]